MNLAGKFIENQAIKVYRNIVFPIKKFKLMFSKRVMFGNKGYADMGTRFDGDNYIGQNSFISKCQFGRGTYVADFSVLFELKSGKFCSIGSGVCTATGKHPVRENIATTPSMFSINPANNLSFTDENLFEDATNPVVLGNDVWIGNGAILMAGITIGDGAIVGAGSVVTKSIEPYEIYVGNPAKSIGKRFSEEEIKRLEKLKWWDKDDSWLKEHAKEFANPGEFLGNI